MSGFDSGTKLAMSLRCFLSEYAMGNEDAALNVIYVEDREVRHSGIRQLLLLLADNVDILEISALQELRVHAKGNHRADLLILDLPFPDCDEYVLISFVRSLYPGVPIVVFSAVDDVDIIFSAMAAGAAGYLLKDSSATMVHEALRLILAGGLFFRHHQLPKLWSSKRNEFTPPVPASVVHAVPESPAAFASSDPVIPVFTARQREVFDLVTKGFSNKEIAKDLGISLGTTKNYVSELLRILGFSNRRQIICSYLREHQTAEGLMRATQYQA